jgi:hypothetical protein
MVKQIQKIKRVMLRLFEEELLAIVAISVVAIFGLLAHAQTSTHTDLRFVICPVGGSLTVISANGGERWKIGSVENIAWETCDLDGLITNVKIELQRDPVAGTWETLIDSTSNDGIYAWLVTEPTTVTALLRISDANDPTMIDTSDDVFEIYEDGGTPPVCETVVIDRVMPWTFSNIEDVTLVITGYFPRGDELVYLGSELLDSTYISETEIDAIVPAGFTPGRYILKVINFCGNYAEYGIRIVIYEEECRDPVIDEVTPQTFSNATDVTLVIKGYFEYEDEEVYLDDELLDYNYISETEMEALVPEGYTPGSYTLSVTNGCGGRAEYGAKIVIYEEEEEEIEEPPLEPIIDIIIKPIIDLFKPVIKPPSTGGVIKPPRVFTPDSRFYTDKFEQNWICYLIWLIILLIFALLMKEYFNEDDPKAMKNKKRIMHNKQTPPSLPSI